jgi:PAS domain S-box-containing protein
MMTRSRLSRFLAGLAPRLDHPSAVESAAEAEARLTAAVEAAARHWRETFDAMPLAIMVLDGDGTVLRANRSAAEALSLPVASLPGQRWARLAVREPWSRAAQLVEAVRAGGSDGAAEVCDEASGMAWEIRVDRALHGGDGTMILSVRDVSEVAEARERARRNESLAALGSVVANVAHEVRNPMLAISAHVEALALQASPDQEESIHAVRAELKRLGRLVGELLEYGRPRGVDFETVSVADVLTAAIDACAPVARSAGVEVHCGQAAAPPVVGDPGRLRRAFVNLIENAVQHSPAGGMVEVMVQTAQRAGRTVVECHVIDGGAGFTPGELARAFEPFYTRRNGGTGLGLPIVRRILSDHGGSVEAGNRSGGGAYTVVRLPAKENA